jgi:putative transposase
VLRRAVEVRLYPKDEQKQILAQHFGCARWWWNYELNKSIETYKETGKSLSYSGLNSLLPALNKEFEWLGECYSQVLQSVSLNLSISLTIVRAERQQAEVALRQSEQQFTRASVDESNLGIKNPISVSINQAL